MLQITWTYLPIGQIDKTDNRESKVFNILLHRTCPDVQSLVAWDVFGRPEASNTHELSSGVFVPTALKALQRQHFLAIFSCSFQICPYFSHEVDIFTLKLAETLW